MSVTHELSGSLYLYSMISLLTGSNSYEIHKAVAARREAFAGDTERYEASELDPRQLPDIVAGATLFSTHRLIIINNATENKPLWGELEQWVDKTSEETDILLVTTNVDKRTKTYKALQKAKAVHEYRDLSEQELFRWVATAAIARGMELSPDVQRYLVRYVGYDQWRLSSELDKLELSGRTVTDELIREVCDPYPEASAFELLDALFAGDREVAHERLVVLADREDPYLFFGLLSSQVYAMLALVHGGSRKPDEIAKQVGVHPFVIKKLSGPAKRLGKQRVHKLVDALARADVKIKTSGADPWRQLEITLFRN